MLETIQIDPTAEPVGRVGAPSRVRTVLVMGDPARAGVGAAILQQAIEKLQAEGLKVIFAEETPVDENTPQALVQALRQSFEQMPLMEKAPRHSDNQPYWRRFEKRVRR
jgi:hypothetical protein